MSDYHETFSLNSSLIVNVKRIFINERTFENYKLIPVQNSAYSYFGAKIIKEPLILPKLYAALTFHTGQSDLFHDDFKGSYSFSFELEVQKNNKSSKYYYIIYHYRSYVEFSIYQIVSKTDPRDDSIMHKPDDELFSNRDMSGFSGFFCSHLIELMEDAKYTPTPFVKYSDSNCLLFGYFENEYFFKACENRDQYEREKESFEGALSAQGADPGVAV